MSSSTPAKNQTTDATRRARAAVLLERWIEEDPAYDEVVSEALEREFEHDGMKCEDRDETGA